MPEQLTSWLSISLYITACLQQCLYINGKIQCPKKTVILLSILAICLHGAILYHAIWQPPIMNLSLHNIFSLIACLITAFILIACISLPLENLLLLILPFAALSLLFLCFLPQSHILTPALNQVSLSHMSISLSAISLLGMASLQAMLLALQNYLLRNKQLSSIVRYLPPLQTMETLLFQIIIVGFILLSASLITGFCLHDHARHLAYLQKAGLSVLAWVFFASLLLGHCRLGWRGPTAVRLTLIGMIILSLAYLGSRLVNVI